MTKAELVKKVAAEVDLTQAATEKVINAAIADIIAAVAEEGKVDLAGFGKFEKKHKDARTGRNPLTGATIEIAASNAPAFKAAKAFKDALN